MLNKYKRWFKYPVTFDLHYTVSHRLIFAPARFLFLLVATILNAYDHSILAPVWLCFNSAFRADKQLLAGILLVLMSVPLLPVLISTFRPTELIAFPWIIALSG